MRNSVLSVARAILQRPRWVVFNQALAGLDPALRERLKAVFVRDLSDVGVLYIGRAQNESGFFGRTVHLVHDPQGPCFKPADAAIARN